MGQLMPAFHEADYYLALRRARRAWEASQPQLVLEGLDAMLTAGEVTSVPAEGFDSLSRSVLGGRKSRSLTASPAASTVHAMLTAGADESADQSGPPRGSGSLLGGDSGGTRPTCVATAPAASTGLDDAPLTARRPVGAKEAGRTGRIVEPAEAPKPPRGRGLE